MQKLTAPLPVNANLPDNWREILNRSDKANATAGRRVSTISSARLVELMLEHNGSGYKVAKLANISAAAVNERRKRIEEALSCRLPRGKPETWMEQPLRRKAQLDMRNGTILIGSDLHCWPEIETTAMRAFAGVNQLLKPDVVILNGDGFDGATTSRHDRLGWEGRPSAKEELEALAEWLDHVQKQNPNGKYYRTIGNHDARFDRYLASVAAQFEGIAGMSLADHIPGWSECMAVYLPDVLMVKHRYRGGIHAARNSALHAGISIVTGHLHSPKVYPITDYRGTRYGVDCGFLASLDHPAFAYAEFDPRDWRPGFVVLTVVDGRLMPPEMAEVVDENEGTFYFRGKLWIT